MSKNYIANKQQFRNYMLGVMKDLYDKVNFTPMDKDENEVTNLYMKLSSFIENECSVDTPTLVRSSFEYKGKTYPALELTNFHTADDVTVAYGIFADEEFMNAEGDCLEYRMLDDRVYAYLPKELIETGTEEEVREFIEANIG